MTVFGEKLFKEMIKQNEVFSVDLKLKMTGVLLRRGNLDTDICVQICRHLHAQKEKDS